MFTLKHSQAYQWISGDVIIWHFASKDLVDHHSVREYITHLVDIGLHTFHDLWCHPAIRALLSCHGKRIAASVYVQTT